MTSENIRIIVDERNPIPVFVYRAPRRHQPTTVYPGLGDIPWSWWRLVQGLLHFIHYMYYIHAWFNSSSKLPSVFQGTLVGMQLQQIMHNMTKTWEGFPQSGVRSPLMQFFIYNMLLYAGDQSDKSQVSLEAHLGIEDSLTGGLRW